MTTHVRTAAQNVALVDATQYTGSLRIVSTAMKGSDFPSQLVDERCATDYKSLAKKKNVAIDATGEQKNNALVVFLRCQVKATKTCKYLAKEYNMCHKSFMGMGSYKGKRHCGEELAALYQCALAGK